MKKIFLCDNVNDGHHTVYQNTLADGIDESIILNKLMNFTDIKKNLFKAYKERKDFINFINSNSDSDCIIHFLYLDGLYKCPFISRYFLRDRNYIGTLHWVPQDKIRIFFLKKISKYLQKIVVHSEYLQNQLNDLNINNVICIDYPSFIDRNIQISKKETNRIVVSCLGGTRSDKGLDVLIDSFKFIEDDAKKRLIFNICGIEQDIKYEDILINANKHDVKIKIKNQYLSDLEYQSEIINSDIILLPYKKIFNGNSGPMTDGVYMGKYIIGPKEGNLGYLIKKYNLGKTFRQEDALDLAKVLSNINKTDLLLNTSYQAKLDIDEFLNKHRQLYREYA